MTFIWVNGYMRHLNFFKIPLTGLFVLLLSSDIVNSQNPELSDTICVQSQLSAKPDHNKISNRKSMGNFYKSDSIFSFHSSKGYFPSILHDIGTQATAPLRFDIKDWAIAGAAVGITATLFSIDDNIDDWARTQKERHKWVNSSSPVISEFGNRYGEYLVCAIGSLSALFKNQKGVQTCLLSTQAIITSGVWVHLIKTLTGRERPKAAYIYSLSESGKWYGPFSRFDSNVASDKSNFAFDAFPSGHTALAFSIATVFATRYNDTELVPILSYSAATLVGITRLTEHEHWVSDVFVGAIIGYLCGKQVVTHFNETHPKDNITLRPNSKNKTEFTFTQYGNQIGLSLKW
jgi:hypothetical protein